MKNYRLVIWSLLLIGILYYISLPEPTGSPEVNSIPLIGKIEKKQTSPKHIKKSHQRLAGKSTTSYSTQSIDYSTGDLKDYLTSDRSHINQDRISFENDYVQLLNKPAGDHITLRYGTTLSPRKEIAKTPIKVPSQPLNVMTVKFKDEILARALSDKRLSLVGQIDKALVEYIEQKELSFSTALKNQARTLRLEDRAAETSGSAQPDLNGTLKVSCSKDDDVIEIARQLNHFSEIEFIEIASSAMPKPPIDIAPLTDDWSHLQSYRTSDGIDIDYAWTFNARGQGIRVTDIEYDVNSAHEDLTEANIIKEPGVSPDETWKDHGTAVMGILAAGDNGYGVLGCTPEADFSTRKRTSVVDTEDFRRSQMLQPTHLSAM